MWSNFVFPVLLLLSMAVKGQSNPPQCFEEGQCSDSIYTGNFIVENVQACLEACRGENDCNFFTYFESDNDCVGFANCANFTTNTCTDCYSGADTCEDLECGTPVQCDGIFISESITIDGQACLNACKSQDTCEWFTYETQGNTCILLENCPLQEPCSTCQTGQKLCSTIEGTSEDYTKLIVVAGYSNGVFGSDVFALDLQNPSATCGEFPPYPIGVDGLKATLFNGVLKACGGYDGYDHGECFDYDFTAGAWLPATNLLELRNFPGSSMIQGQWLLSGGSGTAADTAEVWDGQSWRYAPRLPEAMLGHCQLTVNETHVLFVNGESTNAYLLDWDATTWQELPNLSQVRSYPGCGMVTSDENGLEAVVVSDGSSEVYNFGTRSWRPGPPPVQDGAGYTYGYAQLGSTFTLVGGGYAALAEFTEVQILDAKSYQFVLNQNLAEVLAASGVVAVPDDYVNCS